MKSKILLGLSGGVDSSIAAFLLKKQGYDVIACFMKNYSDTKDTLTGECNWKEEKKMAQKIASKLKIPIIFVDYEKEYKNLVINPMFKSYKNNKTPNPDITCNKLIKFPALWITAKKHNCKLIATGHYAKIKKNKYGFSLHMGRDKNKDQSYFLSSLSQIDLSHTLFPLGNMKKEEVRKIAKKHKFPNWNKKGTRGICFVGKIDFKEFLKKKLKSGPGKVLSPEKEVVGSHPGTVYFTIGERVNNSITINNKYRNKLKKKLFIADKLKHNIIIAPEKHPILYKKEIKISNIKLINPNEPIPKKLKIRIRHRGKLHPGTLVKNTFLLSHPLDQIAPGQTAVFYSFDKLIGSGIII